MHFMYDHDPQLPNLLHYWKLYLLRHLYGVQILEQCHFNLRALFSFLCNLLQPY